MGLYVVTKRTTSKSYLHNKSLTPVENTEAARFINEIVLEEETDEIKEHHVTSHLSYLESMKEIGADTSIIDEFINKIKGSNNYRKQLKILI